MLLFGIHLSSVIQKKQSTALEKLVSEIKQIPIRQNLFDKKISSGIKTKENLFRYETPIPLINHQNHQQFIANLEQNRNKAKSGKNSRNKMNQQMHTLDPEKQLLKKKKMLMEQLRFIDDELRKVQLEKSRSRSLKSKKQTLPDQPQLFYLASSLVNRMNKKRQQATNKKKQEFMSLNNKVSASLKQYQQMNRLKEQQRQQKRRLIQKKIQQRKLKIQQREKLNRQSNTIVSQLKNYKASLPSIIKLNSDESINDVQSNKAKPRQHYQRSIFLDNVMKEEMRKKRDEHFKQYQRKNRRQRQNQYGKKIRGHYKKQDDALFVTKI